MNTLTYTLPNDLQAAVEKSLADWQQNNKTERLWKKDASLWSNRDEAQWLDWLTVIPAKHEDTGMISCFEMRLHGSQP